MKRKLVFVYNADAKIWNKSIDFAHKIISPSTYSCDLCALTHGSFSEKKTWKEFRETTLHEFLFQYKNEFLEKHKEVDYTKFQFPVILEQKKQDFFVLIDSEELTLINTVENLIEKLKQKLS
ncbi:GTPase [Aquimarina sp. 2201CG14-23]|uniref:GTPase n=1 Tax=Aquimarina mycalae TaxID=3040073 RepID=UPI002477FE3A|nr:GTPase [Aquimarina sp. 2201CG14-23]MDH7445179.1 GTPase [Aquimarina sp. 2201CG14-23]